MVYLIKEFNVFFNCIVQVIGQIKGGKSEIIYLGVFFYFTWQKGVCRVFISAVAVQVKAVGLGSTVEEASSSASSSHAWRITPHSTT